MRLSDIVFRIFGGKVLAHDENHIILRTPILTSQEAVKRLAEEYMAFYGHDAKVKTAHRLLRIDRCPRTKTPA